MIHPRGRPTQPNRAGTLLPDGTEHRTGVWIVNQKQRRDRLEREQLAELGVDWAS
ncbi:hypothetical protein ACFRJ1_05230 [Streptomyces sp. NPDC056773]|uniref:hypothetical protein n=1 Tax=unclassified Streptomyces TaxID=2593676 RepID=UPI0036755B9E